MNITANRLTASTVAVLALGLISSLPAQERRAQANKAPAPAAEAPAPAAKAPAGTEGCTACDVVGIQAAPKARLTIRWKRRVVGAAKTTAPCHAATEQALDAAFACLERALSPLGVQVELQKAALADAQFAKDSLRSNRIWINGAALAMYLPGAKSGSVRDVDTEFAMRTIEFAGRSFRDVPAQLIVQAGLVAAAESVKQALAEMHAVGLAGGKQSCCDAPPASGKATDPAAGQPKTR